MVTSRVNRQRSQWALLRIRQPLQVLRELQLHQILFAIPCREWLHFKIRMHREMRILCNKNGRCLSQSIFTAVDFDARQDWRHYIRMRQSKLIQPRARQSNLAQNSRGRQSKLTLLRARQSDLAQNQSSQVKRQTVVNN